MALPHPPARHPHSPSSRPLAPRPSQAGLAGHVTAALAVALAAVLGLVALWWFFVTTDRGQVLDQRALSGALDSDTLDSVARLVLGAVSVPGIIVATVLIVLVAAARRAWGPALAAVVVVGGANVLTQLLKHVVFARPDLSLSGVDVGLNSLPSGHTTVAASLAVAALVVVPRSLRPVVAALGLLYASATGLATLMVSWHRPSDVLAAFLVVLLVTALALLPVRPMVPRSSLVTLVLGFVALLAAFLVVAMVVMMTATGSLVAAFVVGAAATVMFAALMLAGTLRLL